MREFGSEQKLAPDGSELTPPTKPHPDSSVTEIVEAERISKSYVSRILRLALLAPDLVEAILGGWADQRVMLEKLERPLPVGWEEQRKALELPCIARCPAPTHLRVESGQIGVKSCMHQIPEISTSLQQE